MEIRRLVASGAAALIVAGCGDVHGTSGPAGPALSVPHAPELQASASRKVETSGHFDAIVDFSTLSLTPRGRNCLLEVQGRLVFTGTIVGTATGTTSALVSAPCADVAVTPPGTFTDVFKSETTFEGTIDGTPVRANMLYMGGVDVGGHISGRLVFSNGASGRLDAEAQVAVGGEYHGSLVVH